MDKPFEVGDKVRAIGGNRVFIVGEVSGWFWNADNALGAQSMRQMHGYELVEEKQ